jgi:hypothetical protein
MSVMIDDTEELLTVLKKLDVKVNSVDELHHLLTTINSSYDPEAARQKTARQIGVAVPCAAAGAAALASFILLAQAQGLSAASVAIMAVVWGAFALVSMAAVIASAIMLGRPRNPRNMDNPPSRSQSHPERGATGIVKELEI